MPTIREQKATVEKSLLNLSEKINRSSLLFSAPARNDLREYAEELCQMWKIEDTPHFRELSKLAPKYNPAVCSVEDSLALFREIEYYLTANSCYLAPRMVLGATVASASYGGPVDSRTFELIREAARPIRDCYPAGFKGRTARDFVDALYERADSLPASSMPHVIAVCSLVMDSPGDLCWSDEEEETPSLYYNHVDLDDYPTPPRCCDD